MTQPGADRDMYMDCVAKGGKATKEIQWSMGKWLHKEGARPQWVPETQKKLRKWCLKEVMVCKKKRCEVSSKSLSVGNYIHGLGKSHE